MKTYLYLLAYGRSGSTLTDWLLDSHPDIHGLGEIGRMPDCLDINGALPLYCACGARLTQCAFWLPVIKAGSAGKGRRMGWVEWNRKILEHAAASKPEASVVLDSSGHLPRLQRLVRSALSKEYNVKVLYMTRDARGVAYSANVRGYNKGEFKPSLLRASAGWWLRNSQAVNYIRTLPREKVMHVTYEELCENTDSALKSVQGFVGVSPLGLIADWRTQQHHTFAGNVRLRESSSGEVQADMKWTRCLSTSGSLLVESITGRLNRKLLLKRAL